MLLYIALSTTPARLEKLADKAGVVAGPAGPETPIGVEGWRKMAAPGFLFTFAYKDAQKCARHFCVQPQRRIFIDSGAYSVWAKGVEVKLDQYIAFCREIQKVTQCPVTFAALDVIAGKKGETPTPGQKQKACEQGWDNYQQMKKEGIPCVMTFHQGEDMNRWLTRIADDSEYFAVSPRKDWPPAHRFNWLKDVFERIGGSKKIHGLGVSSTAWMKEFPFYSCDNTDAKQGGRAHVWRSPVNGKYWKLREWEEWAKARHLPAKYLGKMLGYSKGVKRDIDPDPDGRSGSYWLMTKAIAYEFQRQHEVTEFWRQRGVVWDEQPHTDHDSES